MFPFKKPKSSPGNQTLSELAEQLLANRGEASGSAIARELTALYHHSQPEARSEFFHFLDHDLAASHDDVKKAANAYLSDPTEAHIQALSDSVEAPRLNLFRALNLATDGIATLVAIREHLGREFSAVEHDLHHLLQSWFNRGFLTLQPINWDSSASVLEKIIQYEAVHEIKGWPDLRSRLLPDRRCFGFFHPAMEGDPIIFVEVALTKGMSDCIGDLISEGRDETDPQEADTAMFYSISNCHKGLRGIGFGNFLIKQVVTVLRAELPHLKRFATLSPVPGFVQWMEQNGIKAMGSELDQLCAAYLMQGTDPVARFHLGNGAELNRINLRANPSETGKKQSRGVMVNYVYNPRHIERNHENFITKGKVIASREVKKLAKAAAGG